MDVDERLRRVGCLEERVPARRHLTEPATDRKDEVGVAESARDRLVHRDAQHADVARRAVVDVVLAAEGHGDGKGVRLAERLHVAARLGRPAALTRDDERTLGCGEELAQASEVLHARHHGLCVDARSVGDVGLFREHVFGEREHDRPRPAGDRERVRLGDVLGDSRSRIDLPRRLRDAAEDLGVVELLPRLTATKGARHLPDEEDHRRRVLFRRVDADRRLRRPRAARHETDARPARELPIRLRRVGGALFVPARDEPDR